jgi:hypothetical protein
MTVGVAPAASLFLALGLALAFASRRTRASSLLALGATLGALSFVPTPRSWLEGVFLGCWLAVIATAASVHLAGGLGSFAAVVLSVDAGVWASAVVSVSGSRLDLLRALPCLLIVWPASWVVRRHESVAVKVVASWLMAVAVLAITLRLLPITPGYLPDHLE